MRMMSHDCVGEELDWVAHDLVSSVAYFSSAGIGPVPDLAEADGSRIDDLNERLLALPRISEACWTVGPHYNHDEWFNIAERALFAFDWNHEAKLYVLVAFPVRAIVAAGIPELLLRDHILGIRLPTYFGRANQLNPKLHSYSDGF